LNLYFNSLPTVNTFTINCCRSIELKSALHELLIGIPLFVVCIRLVVYDSIFTNTS